MQNNPFLEEAEDNLRKQVLDIAKFGKILVIKLADKLPDDPMRLIYLEGATIFLMGYDRSQLCERVIVNSVKFWDLIYSRDESFFLEKADEVFGEIPCDSRIFAAIFKSRILSDKDKTKLWDMFNDIVKYCCLFIHERREPTKKIIDGKERGTYDKSFMNEIKLRQWVERYNIKLRF
jgi:hypothetical protein